MQISRKLNQRIAVPLQQFRQILLKDWHFAFSKSSDLGFIVINANYVMTDFSQAYSCHQSHVALTHNSNRNLLIHIYSLFTSTTNFKTQLTYRCWTATEDRLPALMRCTNIFRIVMAVLLIE